MPSVRTSRGSTKISLEGAWVYDPPPPERREKRPEAAAQHADASEAFNVVYFNDAAEAALKGGRPLKFPAGSVIVSERLSKPGDATPQVLAVMLKRPAGFSPQSGDWEFLVVDGALTKVRERQKKGSCLKCHASRRDDDFVFPPK
ncbi:MAG TPA: cytochrome P460 family protein [Pyrinomonadaceae bacterium]|nr:cytochrome P460 family protein [Pyrinomonadaceae bacterium]